MNYNTVDATKMLYSILYSNRNDVCFLCLKTQSKGLLSIYSELDIFNDCFNLKISLTEIMKQLFPSHETLFDQACEECTNLLLKIFLKLRKYNTNIKILKDIIKNLDSKVEKTDTENKNKIVLNMNEPETKIIEEKKPTNKRKKTFKCTKCDIKFNSNDLLKDHKNCLHKNNSNATVCDVCGQTFKTPTSLRAHSNCHKEIECPYCFKTLKTHSYYKIHIKRHKTNVKRERNKVYHSCNHCKYQSSNKNTLEAHINKMHLHIRPYVCETCDKGFYKKSHLTEHVKIHSQIKNKTCDVCGELFLYKQTLIEHQRLHDNIRPYECDICKKKFVTSGRRSDHIKRCHMEKTEFCTFCDKKYSLRNELNRHLKNSHADCFKIDSNIDVNVSNIIYNTVLLN